MNILLVTQHFHPSVGGAEVMLRRLAGCWVKAGCQVLVLTQLHDRNSARTETMEGFTVVRLPTMRLRVLGTLHFIASLRRQLAANEGAFDVVFVSMFKHAAYAAMTTKWNRPPPIVLRAEGAGPTGDMAWQDAARFGKSIRSACQGADAFVAPSAEIASELKSRGYREDAIHEIANGVPIPKQAWRSEDVNRARSAVGIPNRTIIVYTGRLHLDKGLGDLIDAAAILHKGGRSIMVCLVGDGPERETLQRRAAEKGVADLVRFIGNVPSVEPYLRAAALFVLPSYQEGLSVSLLEALAIGMPCLASDIPANRNLVPAEMLPTFPIRNAKALAAAIGKRIDEPKADLNRQRRIVSDHFSIDVTANRHLEAFRKLLKRKDKGR